MEEAQMHMQLPIFNGEDHEIWCIKMITLLMSRDLWDVVKGGSTDNRQKELHLKDMTALHMIQMSVTRSIFFKIAKATSSKQAWEILKQEFGETEEIRGMKVGYLHTKFFETMMDKEESVSDYIEKLMEIANEIKYYGSQFGDSHIINKILRNLPSRFERMVEFLRGKKLTLTHVVYRLKEYELDVCKRCEELASHDQETSQCYTKNKRGRQ